MSNLRDCRSLLPLLAPYVDGELSSDEQWRVETHIATCAVCGKVVADFAATARMMQSLPTPELSADFDSRLAGRLADITLAPRRPRLLDRLRLAWAIAPARPVWATVAVVAMVPLFAIATVRLAQRPVPAVANGADSSTLETLVGDHVRAASIEPLGGTASLMLASAPATGPEGAGY
jgi:anti-sigma factor RsiW